MEILAVKIKCPRCGTYWAVSGRPVRGFAEYQTTHAVDWQPMNEHELMSWRRWFHSCPTCDEALEYYEGRPEEPNVAS